ncbi:MAG: hypothetical protein HY926_15450 [Elusimicrobia bacterium]|nr:hypothetical protein [Elusimicrobiota bacterium]
MRELRDFGGESLGERILAGILGIPFLLVMVGFILAMLYFSWEAGRMALKARGWQYRYSRGAAEATHGTAVVDLTLARKALDRGDAAAAEARASGARDKLDSPHAPSGSSAAVRDLKVLEEQQAGRFRPIRRQRALKRLGKEGAEIRP